MAARSRGRQAKARRIRNTHRVKRRGADTNQRDCDEPCDFTGYYRSFVFAESFNRPRL